MAQGRAAVVQSPEGDLVISQGSDNTFVYRYSTSDGTTTTPVDLTGWQARAQIRRQPGGEVWVSLDSTAATAAGSTIALAVDGTITVYLHHAETEPWPVSRASSMDSSGALVPSGVWDLELVAPTGEVKRLVMGRVSVSADVTRA